jgi:hypothetical protein
MRNCVFCILLAPGPSRDVEVLLPKDERESSELDGEVSEAQTVRVFPTLDDWRRGKYRG